MEFQNRSFQIEIRGLPRDFRESCKGFGHSIEFQHSVPPVDGWTIGKSDLSVGRYGERLCD